MAPNEQIFRIGLKPTWPTLVTQGAPYKDMNVNKQQWPWNESQWPIWLSVTVIISWCKRSNWSGARKSDACSSFGSGASQQYALSSLIGFKACTSANTNTNTDTSTNDCHSFSTRASEIHSLSSLVDFEAKKIRKISFKQIQTLI